MKNKKTKNRKSLKTSSINSPKKANDFYINTKINIIYLNHDETENKRYREKMNDLYLTINDI